MEDQRMHMELLMPDESLKKTFLFYSTHITVLICLLHCDFYCKIGNFGLCALWQLACKWMWQCRKSLSASHCLHEGRNGSQFRKWTSHDNTESRYKYPDHQIFKIVGLEPWMEWWNTDITSDWHFIRDYLSAQNTFKLQPKMAY